MKEIKNYDTAANKFYTSQNIKSLPLICWDFFGMHFNTLCKNFNDALALTELAKKNNWQYKDGFEEELMDKEQIIVVTDAKLTIVHATHNIFQMNGYTSDEIVGRKPKIFQGKDTCQKTSERIRRAIRNKKPFEATILNYHKDGSPYKCWIKGEPIFNESGKVVNFIAYEKEVA